MGTLIKSECTYMLASWDLMSWLKQKLHLSRKLQPGIFNNFNKLDLVTFGEISLIVLPVSYNMEHLNEKAIRS